MSGRRGPTRRDALRAAVWAAVARPAASPASQTPPPFRVGPFERVYRPGPRGGDGRAPGGWHMNDHCFVKRPDGLWHLFGIAWTDPGVTPEPTAAFLEHATSPALTGKDASWTRRPSVMALSGDRFETVMWAPHVVRHGGLYHMFVATGGRDLTRWGITHATSTDLEAWTRVGDGPAFRDGFQARDPMLHRRGDGTWVVYYTATERPDGGRHVVAYRTSPDLDRWSDRRVAFLDPHVGTDYGPTESPFVVERGGFHWLFLGPRPYDPPTAALPNFRHPGYDGTDVYRSRDGFRWAEADLVGHLPAHAPELVEDGGRWYVSRCGVARGGLELAPFHWTD